MAIFTKFHQNKITFVKDKNKIVNQKVGFCIILTDSILRFSKVDKNKSCLPLNCCFHPLYVLEQNYVLLNRQLIVDYLNIH